MNFGVALRRGAHVQISGEMICDHEMVLVGFLASRAWAHEITTCQLKGRSDDVKLHEAGWLSSSQLHHLAGVAGTDIST